MDKLHSWHGSAKNCVFCIKCAMFRAVFALFSSASGCDTMPEGYYVNQGAGGVTPKNIRWEQKVTFLGVLKFRKAEKSQKKKKDPI